MGWLNLEGNQISGEVPTSLGAFTALTRLFLQRNGGITGVPTDIGALTGLIALDLGDNVITALPTEMGALTSMQYLLLEDNALSSLPTEIGALTGLVNLDLEDNQLTGFPAELQTWDMSNNCVLASNDPGFSCANVGAGTACCTASNCPNGGTSTCYTPPACTYADITCIAGDNCPEGTLVSAACADRSAFNENPCACTALQELAALSAANLAGQAPWSNLATASYCTLDSGNYPVSEPHWIAVPVSGGRAERLTDWRAGCSTTLTTTIWISTSGARWSTVWSCPMSVSVAG